MQGVSLPLEAQGFSHEARLDMTLGKACISDCVFCNEHGRTAKRTVTSLEEARALLERHQGGHIQQAYITGGEPTLNKDIHKYIALAKELGYPEISLITNGRRLRDEKYARSLLEVGLNRITVSIHGHNAELGDRISQVPGSWDQQVEALRVLAKLAKEYDLYRIATVVVHSLNYRFLREICVFLDREGIEFIHLQVVEARGRGASDFHKVNPSYSAMAKEMQRVFQKPYQHFVDKVLIDGIPFCVMQGFEDLAGRRSDIYFNRSQGLNEILHNTFRQKREECQSCAWMGVCEGVWDEYIEALGWDEFQPVAKTVEGYDATKRLSRPPPAKEAQARNERVGNLKKASLLKKQAELLPAGPVRRKLWFHTAVVLYKARDLEAAQKVLTQLLGEMPNHPEARLWMGRIWMEREFVSEARAELEEARNLLKDPVAKRECETMLMGLAAEVISN